MEVDDPDGVIGDADAEGAAGGGAAGGGAAGGGGAENGGGGGKKPRKKKDLKPSDILSLVGEMSVAKKELREQEGVINSLKNKLEIFGDLEEAKVRIAHLTVTAETDTASDQHY